MTITSENSTFYKEALFAYEQGNYNHALQLFKKAGIDQHSAEIEILIDNCKRKIARKLWLQSLPKELESFLSEMKPSDSLLLALARLKGRESLHQLSQKSNGLASLLAHCSSEENLQAALLRLRQIPEMKFIAEGWICLLKGDSDRAAALFRQAKEQAPLQARVGEGIAYLALISFSQAEELLGPFKTIAKRRFPHLAKIMCWGSQSQMDVFSAESLFTYSLPDLQRLLGSVPADKKELLGWIHLKIGDHLGMKNDVKALSHWRKAENVHPAFRLTVQKRLFVVSRKEAFGIDPETAFLELYKECRRKSPSQAQQFIEYMVFHSDIFISSVLTKSGHENFERQISLSIPLEWNLLTLHLCYQALLTRLYHVLFLSESPIETIKDLTWEEWCGKLSQLDSMYGHHEKYLHYKFTLAYVFDKQNAVRETAYRLMRLNPHSQDSLLPHYTRAAFSHKEEELNQIRSEIQSLLLLFPSSFDLLRLSIVFDPDENRWQEQLLASSTKISESLFAVLKLQIAVDKGFKREKCLELIPFKSLLNRNREADWRLLSVLHHPIFKNNQKEMEKWISLLAPTDELIHEFFSHMHLYKETSPVIGFLKTWKKRSPKSWQPSYHLALHYFRCENLDEGIKMLMKLSRSIPETSKESLVVENTLDFYCPEDPMEELMQLLKGKYN